jgi:hypothetical protein
LLKNAKPREAINQRNLALLDDHPGYWQTRQVFPLLFTSFPDVSSTIEQQTVDGTWVTTRTTLRGTHMGAFMGVAPTGKAIEIMHISLDQVEEGKLGVGRLPHLCSQVVVNAVVFSSTKDFSKFGSTRKTLPIGRIFLVT